MALRTVTELVDADPDFVSIVDKGANRKVWKVLKRQVPDDADEDVTAHQSAAQSILSRMRVLGSMLEGLGVKMTKMSNNNHKKYRKVKGDGIVALAFPASDFTVDTARDWAHAHDFSAGKIETRDDVVLVLQDDATSIDLDVADCALLELDDGVRAVKACAIDPAQTLDAFRSEVSALVDAQYATGSAGGGTSTDGGLTYALPTDVPAYAWICDLYPDFAIVDYAEELYRHELVRTLDGVLTMSQGVPVDKVYVASAEKRMGLPYTAQLATPERVRAAWAMVEHRAGKLDAKDLLSIRARIADAWRKMIDANGPPLSWDQSIKDAAADLRRHLATDIATDTSADIEAHVDKAVVALRTELLASLTTHKAQADRPDAEDEMELKELAEKLDKIAGSIGTFDTRLSAIESRFTAEADEATQKAEASRQADLVKKAEDDRAAADTARKAEQEALVKPLVDKIAELQAQAVSSAAKAEQRIADIERRAFVTRRKGSIADRTPTLENSSASAGVFGNGLMPWDRARGATTESE